jgi:hypothetical protein
MARPDSTAGCQKYEPIQTFKAGRISVVEARCVALPQRNREFPLDIIPSSPHHRLPFPMPRLRPGEIRWEQ